MLTHKRLPKIYKIIINKFLVYNGQGLHINFTSQRFHIVFVSICYEITCFRKSIWKQVVFLEISFEQGGIFYGQLCKSLPTAKYYYLIIQWKTKISVICHPSRVNCYKFSKDIPKGLRVKISFRLKELINNIIWHAYIVSIKFN